MRGEKCEGGRSGRVREENKNGEKAGTEGDRLFLTGKFIIGQILQIIEMGVGRGYT